jgi:hypothetical protein
MDQLKKEILASKVGADSVVDPNSILGQLQAGKIKFSPPAPSNAVLRQIKETGDASPDPFYQMPVVFFIPHITYARVKIKCPHCDTESQHHKSMSSMRRFVGLDASYLLVTYVYRCSNEKCKTPKGARRSFYATHPGCFKSFPEYVQNAFPALLSKRLALDCSLTLLMGSFLDSGGNFTGFAKMIEELQHQTFQSAMLSYERICNDAVETKRRLNLEMGRVEKFKLDFGDQQGYSGYVPSAQYYLSVFLRMAKMMEPFWTAYTQRLHSNVLSFDHSFKVLEISI